jgi:hypothetical protein
MVSDVSIPFGRVNSVGDPSKIPQATARSSATTSTAKDGREKRLAFGVHF